MKKENDRLFEGTTPMDVVQKRLEIPGAEVKPVDDRKFLVKYCGQNYVVAKGKEGYRASVDIPGYLFWVLLLLMFLVIFFVRGGSSIGSTGDSLVSFISFSLGAALVPAFVLYWIIAEIISASKKKGLKEYCDKVLSD